MTAAPFYALTTADLTDQAVELVERLEAQGTPLNMPQARRLLQDYIEREIETMRETLAESFLKSKTSDRAIARVKELLR